MRVTLVFNPVLYDRQLTGRGIFERFEVNMHYMRRRGFPYCRFRKCHFKREGSLGVRGGVGVKVQ